MSTSVAEAPWLARLRRIGAIRYHHRHPFNALMHAGRLDHGDLRLWVANRYYYQTRIPIKDAIILSKSEDRQFRRAWIQRILDHDGRGEQQVGGIELWVRLGSALGLSRQQLDSQTELLPAVREACDEYVELVRRSDLVTAVASSLTEYFAGDLMQTRLEAWKRHYPAIASQALRYFEERIVQAPQDAAFALEFVGRHASTAEREQRCLDAFERKCEILWRLLCAVYLARRRDRRPSLAARASLVQRSGRPALLLGPEQALELNPSAAALLERADGEASVGQLAHSLSVDHRAPLAEVEFDIAAFLGELELRRLIRFSAEGRA
ncbi:MAG: pyrroloquinoline-quinone synthase PqqC [Enhygromyxa sp.]